MEKNTATDSNKVLEIPILKHFDPSTISFDPKNWREGEKPIAALIGLGIFGGIGYGVFKYIMPVVFGWIGQVLGAISASVLAMAFFIFLPIIIKGLKRLARATHKLLIKYDPFGELDEQKQKMIENRQNFKNSKAKIKSIKSQMEAESLKAEKESKEYQDKVLLLQERAAKGKSSIASLEQKNGDAAKETDEYVEIQSNLLKTLSEAQRVGHLLNQSTDLIRKYGTRAHAIGKLDRKLQLVDTAMEIKIADFDVSIDMLKKEFAFAKAAKEATEQAKSAMLFSAGWELDYALDVVTSTVATDLALTRENLTDLDSLTSKYSLDSDELYSKLDKLADQIKTDNYEVPESKKYSNPNYKLSDKDKSESSGFGDIFN
jgi:hypothetical protein